MRDQYNMGHFRIKAVGLLLILLLNNGCKKRHETTVVETPQTTFVNSDSTNSIITVSNTYNFKNGNFQLDNIYVLAGFYNESREKESPLGIRGIDVGVVKVNTKELTQFQGQSFYDYYYLDTLALQRPTTWIIQGKETFKPFAYTDNTPYPTYNGVANLPETIYPDSINIINITNFSGADEIQLQLLTNPNSPEIVAKQIDAQNNSFKFLVPDLSHDEWYIETTCQLRITLTKNNFVRVHGKVINFKTENIYFTDFIPFKL